MNAEPNPALELQFLGTGTPHGVPMIGCDCAVCRSDDPRDRRNRSAVTVTAPGGGTILIDAPPELRLAAVAAGLQRVDAICLTHAHADHVMGLDDVRRFNDIIGRSIDVYGNAETLATVRQCFGYAEKDFAHKPSNRPALRFVEVDGPFEAAGMDVQPVPLLHGPDEILGFRIGPLAYCTDCSEIPPDSMRMLTGLQLLVLDALRHRPHPTHFNLDQALAIIEELAPDRALLPHLTHEIPHARTSEDLPETIDIAYDLLRVRMSRAE